MAKNNRKPKKVIDLNNGRKGSYIIYSLCTEGNYSRNGAPKDVSNVLPFIDRKVYDGITPRAKKDLLSSCTIKRRDKIVKRLTEVELGKRF
jgi:hypothetical protein